MGAFAGFEAATTEEFLDAISVMDIFHVIRFAGDALNECHRRIQHELRAYRGRKG